MTNSQTATFSSARAMPPYWAVHFEVAHPPAPGAFMLADLGGPLREPLFPALIEDAGFTTMAPPGHPATRLLPGAEVDMLGPLGRGFHIDELTARLLLIAEAAYLPALLPLLDATSSVAVVVEAATRAQIPAPHRFPPAVELYLVTRDGSTGYLGPLESDDPAPADLQRAAPQLRELLAWAGCICLALESSRYPTLAAMLREARHQPRRGLAQALIRAPMPCGVGVCEVCLVTTRRGEKHACVDGPVFDLLDLAAG